MFQSIFWRWNPKPIFTRDYVMKGQMNYYLISMIQGKRTDNKYVAEVARDDEPSKKFILKTHMSCECAKSELLVLMGVPKNNSYLVMAHEWLCCKDQYYFIYEKEDIDLFTVLTIPTYHKYCKEKWLEYYMRRIVKAVQYLHVHEIIHYDLKFENIVINLKTRKVRLIDFECCQRWNEPKKYLGTPEYMSPEIRLYKEFVMYDAGKQDIWSLGILYILILFKRISVRPMMNMMDYQKLIDKIPDTHFVKDCLRMNPNERLNIHELSNVVSKKMATPENLLITGKEISTTHNPIY